MTIEATYHLVLQPSDYKLAHGFIRDEEVPEHTLSFPTIMGIDEEGEIIGLLGTYMQGGLIVAAPLVVRGMNNPGRKNILTFGPVILRLLDTYEYVLRKNNVTSYIWTIDKANKPLLRLAKEMFDVEPYSETEESEFFIRRLR